MITQLPQTDEVNTMPVEWLAEKVLELKKAGTSIGLPALLDVNRFLDDAAMRLAQEFNDRLTSS